MFYSHEVLTSRKYGVATIWLVATLGSKSALKKVTRKAIQDVDVQKACKTITMTDTPLALRLQSNLLYGIARVYAQQCGYVLNDAEAARNQMRTIVKAVKTGGLDVRAHEKGRADQLLLPDDPNLFHDFDIAALDFDLDMSLAEEPQHLTFSSNASQLSAPQNVVGVGSPEDIGGLEIPPSASSFAGGPVGGGFASFSMRGDEGVGERVNFDDRFMDDDLGIEIALDGRLRMSATPAQRGAGSIEGQKRASSAVARDQQLGQQDEVLREGLGPPDEDGFVAFQDDYNPPLGSDKAAAQSFIVQPLHQETSEETAEAPQRRRPMPKTLSLDQDLSVSNRTIADWGRNYLANMQDASRSKISAQAAAQAKKNAEFWMLGQSDRGPLNIFTGARLLETLTGINVLTGTKHARDEDANENETRRVRPRSNTNPSSDELARGFDDDGAAPYFQQEDSLEHVREAPTPLDDRHLSSLMPWNQGSGTGSRRPTALFGSAAGGIPTSASMPGAHGVMFPPSASGRRGSRLTSASPLLGRGTIPAGVHQSAAASDDFQLQHAGGEDVEMHDAAYQLADGTDTQLAAFELHGPAAAVDTQTANKPTWVAAALEREGANFFDFVRGAVQAKDEASDDAEEDMEGAAGGSVTFDALLPPAQHSAVVAAQGLLHVLALATAGLLGVEQEGCFGEITVRVS